MTNDQALSIQIGAAVVQTVILAWYTFVTHKISDATKKSAEAGARSAELTAQAFWISSRPFVGVTTFEFVPPGTQNVRQGILKAEVKNFGTVPASIDRAVLLFRPSSGPNARTADQDPIEMRRPSEYGDNRGMLFPQEDSELVATISADDWNQLLLGKLRIGIEAEVDYHATSGKSYTYRGKYVLVGPPPSIANISAEIT